MSFRGCIIHSVYHINERGIKLYTNNSYNNHISIRYRKHIELLTNYSLTKRIYICI